MANTGYTINEGIQQVFTSGPVGIINSLVTSSYSNGIATFGPAVDFKELFVSGTIESLYPCATVYNRYYLDPINCPVSGCPQPILNSVLANCDPYNYTYSVSYNFISSSGFVPTTKIEYSTTSNFSTNTGSVTYDNTQPSQLPVDVSGLPFPPVSQTLVYFRALNNCIGNGQPPSSSYSNIISASCAAPPPTQRPTVTVTNNNETFPGNETIFRINGTQGYIVNYSTSQVNSGANGAYIEMFDQFGVQYTIDAYNTRSGTITIPASGQISFTINYIANASTNSQINNVVSQILTFLDSSNSGKPLGPDGSIYLSDERSNQV